jgi:adenylosuccinate synthase
LWFDTQHRSTISRSTSVSHAARCLTKHRYRINLTKLDVLDTFETIKVATSYEIDGGELKSFPASLETLSKANVKYAILKGWQKSIKGIKNYDELPLECKNYVEFVEGAVGVKIAWIGVGPDREDMIAR